MKTVLLQLEKHNEQIKLSDQNLEMISVLDSKILEHDMENKMEFVIFPLVFSSYHTVLENRENEEEDSFHDLQPLID